MKCPFCTEEVKDETVICKHCLQLIGSLPKLKPTLSEKRISFKRCTLASIAVLLLSAILSALICLTSPFKFGFWLSVICILVYLYVAHVYIEYIMEVIWQYIRLPRTPQRLTATLGNIDRIIYATCVAMGEKYFHFIGVWLGIKIISRILEKRSASFEEQGHRKNAYLIGNLISLALGLLGGALIILLKRLN